MMRLHRIECPKCRAVLNSKAGIEEGQRVNCPKCKSPFNAVSPDEPEVVEDADVVEDEFEVVEDDQPAPKRKTAERPVKTSGRRPTDERNDDRPRRRRRDDDDEDEDEDDRPRRRKKGRARDESTYRKLKSNLAVRVATLAVLLTILGVLTYLFIEKRKRDQEAEEHNRRMVGDTGSVGSVGDSAVVRRLAGKWVFDPASGPQPSVISEYEFLTDGTLKDQNVFANGPPHPPKTAKWRVKDSRGDSGVLEFLTEDFGWLKYKFKLVNGGAGLIITPLDTEEKAGQYKRAA